MRQVMTVERRCIISWLDEHQTINVKQARAYLGLTDNQTALNMLWRMERAGMVVKSFKGGCSHPSTYVLPTQTGDTHVHN